MNKTLARLAAAALGAGLIAVPSVAFAADERPDRPERAERAERAERTDIRERCQHAVDRRQEALDKASERLAAHRHVSDDHEAALAGILDETAAAMDALEADIAGAADPAALKEACSSVFEDRVFGLVLPRTRLVAGSDSALAAAVKLTEVAEKIGAAIESAEEAGDDVTGLRPDLAEMRVNIADARSSADDVPGAVMGLTAADWNADHAVLLPARNDLRSARSDLREARDLGRRIAHELRSQ